MLAGDPYIADDPQLALESRRAVELQAQYAELFPKDYDAAKKVLRELLGSVGEDVEIKAPLYVDYGTYISIGDRTFINYGLTALDVAPITIGADCMIGPNCSLLTPTHPIEPEPRRDKIEGAAPIVLGDNVWLGGNVTVCPGVTIGENSVIGAGAVVTKDIPANSVAVGNPAKVIKSL